MPTLHHHISASGSDKDLKLANPALVAFGKRGSAGHADAGQCRHSTASGLGNVEAILTLSDAVLLSLVEVALGTATQFCARFGSHSLADQGQNLL